LVSFKIFLLITKIIVCCYSLQLSTKNVSTFTTTMTPIFCMIVYGAMCFYWHPLYLCHPHYVRSYYHGFSLLFHGFWLSFCKFFNGDLLLRNGLPRLQNYSKSLLIFSLEAIMSIFDCVCISLVILILFYFIFLKKC
jgi:hypothetical protein